MRRQYGDPTNLATRVGLYAYLIPDQDVGDATFEEWVLDHVDWRGSEAVLDVGRGAGAYESALRRRAAVVVGLDLSPGMLVAAAPAAAVTPGQAGTAGQAGAAGSCAVGLVVGDAQDLPVPDGAFDVVLSAHMLYHVPDVERALHEVRRAVRPGGTTLFAGNGAADKQEIRALWAEAVAAVGPPQFPIPAWARRFNLDDSLGLVRRVFPDTSVDLLTGRFRFSTSDPVMAWVDSLRAGAEDDVGPEAWDAVAADLAERVQSQIDRDGAFVVTKVSGVLVAR
jgi:SAM-dependent methyltransferase